MVTAARQVLPAQPATGPDPLEEWSWLGAPINDVADLAREGWASIPDLAARYQRSRKQVRTILRRAGAEFALFRVMVWDVGGPRLVSYARLPSASRSAGGSGSSSKTTCTASRAMVRPSTSPRTGRHRAAKRG